MSKFKIVGLLVVVVYIAAAIATSVVLTPQDIEDLKQKAVAASKSTDGKDMKTYINDIWATKIIPEYEETAMDLNEVLTGLKDNPEEFAKKYGKRNNDFSPMNYVVKGKAKVTKVNTKSAAGSIALDVKDLSGKKDVLIQIGPVIKKTAIRDSLSFISFNDFVNQIEFGEVSKEIKNYIMNNVVNTVKENDLEGKEIEFLGAFTYDKRRGKVLISPVKINY